jgi:hypothetical protein
VGNLYLLRLTYKLRPIERQLPTARDKKTREEADLIRMFSDAFASRTHHPSDIALARRLLSHEQAELIVAGLLRDHLGARPDAVEEATAARRARAPRPVEVAPVAPQAEAPRTPMRPSPPGRDAGPSSGRDPAVTHSIPEPPRTERSGERAGEDEVEPLREVPQTDPTSEDESPPEENGANELYVSVGRRDGAKPSDYHAVLEAAGIGPESLEYVRVRHRHAFVGVREGEVERALAALNGALIAGRRANAERARRA